MSIHLFDKLITFSLQFVDVLAMLPFALRFRFVIAQNLENGLNLGQSIMKKIQKFRHRLHHGTESGHIALIVFPIWLFAYMV